MPHLLPSTGCDESGAKRPWQDKKGALHQNTFCLGSFLTWLNSPPSPVAASHQRCCKHFSSPRPHPSLAPTPTCLHIHYIFFFNMHCDCPVLRAHWKRSACSSLIGWAPSDPLSPPLLLQQVGRSMAAHDPSNWCLPVQAKRQIYPETMAPRTFSLYRLICVSLSIWTHLFSSLNVLESNGKFTFAWFAQ